MCKCPQSARDTQYSLFSGLFLVIGFSVVDGKPINVTLQYRFCIFKDRCPEVQGSTANIMMNYAVHWLLYATRFDEIKI
jgi:hypothetical protein